MTSKKWAIKTIAISAVILMLMATFTFIIDPLYQYRYSEDSDYYVNPRYSCAGLIKTYDYDSVMLGSSITQNFDPDLFSEKMNLKLLKVNIGGMSVPETVFYLDYIRQSGKAETVFASVDLQRFVLDEGEASFNIPEHLANGYGDDYRYLLSSDVYTRFLPVDIFIKVLKLFNIEQPDFMKMSTDIDEMGSWHHQNKCSEEIFLESFEKNGFGVSEIKLDGIDQKLKVNIDTLFNALDKYDGDTQINLFFPPYSSMYWVYAKENGHFDSFMKAKEYVVEKSQNYKNVNVYDFQNIEYTSDLNYYRDISHYSKDINDYMVDYFAQGSYIVKSKDDVILNAEQISARCDDFSLKYSDYIKKYGQSGIQ